MHFARGRWALLRHDGRGYKCLYISPDMKHPGSDPKNPAPLQLFAITTSDTSSSPPIAMRREIVEDDVIIAGSDGLFDNLILLPKPAGAENLRRPTPPDKTLRACLEDHVRQTSLECKRACAVCKAMHRGKGGGRAPVMCIGESLQRVAADNMKRGGNPDDLTIFVTRVSMGSLPDLTKSTCAEMQV